MKKFEYKDMNICYVSISIRTVSTQNTHTHIRCTRAHMESMS